MSDTRTSERRWPPPPPPDPALPALDALFDGDAMAEVIRRRLPDFAAGDLSLRACRPSYVRYKPGTSCLVGYDIEYGVPEGGGETVRSTVHVRQFAGDGATAAWAHPALGRLRQRTRRHHPGSPRDHVALVPELGAVLSLYPSDVDLRGLVRASAPETMVRRLSAALPTDRGPVTGCRPRLVRYKPGRKAVFRYELDGGPAASVYAKVMDGDIEGRFAVHRALVAAGVPTSDPIVCLPELGMILQSEVSGTRLAGLPPADALAHLPAMTEALARVHAAAVPEPRPWSVDDEAAALMATARALGTIVPRMRFVAEGVATRVAAGLAGAQTSPVPLHGDFYDDQVMISGSKATLLDFDEVRLGDPLFDLATFLAHTAAEAGADDEAVEEARSVILAAYPSPLPDARARLAVFESAALLRLAVAPFRLLASTWPDDVGRLVGLAERRLGQGGD